MPLIEVISGYLIPATVNRIMPLQARLPFSWRETNHLRSLGKRYTLATCRISVHTSNGEAKSVVEERPVNAGGYCQCRSLVVLYYPTDTNSHASLTRNACWWRWRSAPACSGIQCRYVVAVRKPFCSEVCREGLREMLRKFGILDHQIARHDFANPCKVRVG